MNQEVYLLESLSAALSENPESRKQGEDALKILDATENFGVMLTCNIVNNPSQVPPHVRQFGAIVLKQYVDCHWSRAADKFQEPEVTPRAKAVIMEALPSLLADDNSKIRSAVAYAISAIASWEWPDNWPGLFPIIIQGVKSGNEFSLDGAIRVLNEISAEVNVDQIFQMFPVVVPEILAILRNFTSNQLNHISIVARTLKVYQTLVIILAEAPDIKLSFKVIESHLGDIVIEVDKFVRQPLLENEVHEPKISCISLVHNLCKHFPKLMHPVLENGLMISIVKLYESVSQQYCKLAVYSNDIFDASLEDESAGLLDLANEIILLFSNVYANNKLYKTISQSLSDIIFCSILLAQPSESALESWETDPGQFMEDDEMDSTRHYAASFIAEVFSNPKKSPGLCPITMLARAITNSEKMYSMGDPNWWKLCEASLFVLSQLSTLSDSIINEAHLKQLWESFFVHNKQKPSFLIASEIETASNFFDRMPHDLFVRFLTTANSGLDSTHPEFVRLHSLKAIQNLDVFIEKSNEVVVQSVHELFPDLVIKIIQLQLEMEKKDSMHYILDVALQSLIALTDLCAREDLFQKVEPQLGPFALALWIKNNNEMIITELCKTLLGNLCKFQSSAEVVCKRVVPTLMSILKSRHVTGISSVGDNIGASAVALDLLTELVKRCQGKYCQDVLGDDVFMFCMQFTLESDDTAVVQNGCDLLKSYVSSFSEQILLWRRTHSEQHVANNSDNEKNALYYVVNIILKILSPDTAEMGAVFVGRLMAVVLLHLSNHILPHLDQILKAVLSKMQQAKALSVFMSLITIYAILVNHKLAEVVEFLSSLPDPSGKSALEYVLREWVINQNGFYGSFERQVTCVALSKLLQHILVASDHHTQNLKTMMVKGDLIISENKENSGPTTRSKGKVMDQYTSIPLPIKILKLLLQEYQSACDKYEDELNSPKKSTKGSSHTENSSVVKPNGDCSNDEILLDDENVIESDSNSSGDEDEDEDASYGGRNYVTVDEFFTGQGQSMVSCGELNDEEIDEDLKNDPFVSLNLKQYLAQYFQQLKLLPFYNDFECALNSHEVKIMQQF